MTNLFSPLTLRGVTIPNRIALPPMCQYGAVDGMANEGHFARYARFALGGMGLIIVESTVVDPAGRVCDSDLGLWDDAQVSPFRRITSFISAQGAVPAIQLAHGGRKAGQRRPWEGFAPINQTHASGGGLPCQVVGPSPLAVADGWPVPEAMDSGDIKRMVTIWANAAQRAGEAGFEAIEIHAGHGYLLHQFLSPLTNLRQDGYGGSRDGRMRFPLEVVEGIRKVWPTDKPLLVRLSSVDGAEGGWCIEDTVALARELKARGVDMIDCSSGGLFGSSLSVHARIPRVPGYQVPYAEQVRREAGICTIAVGLIQTAQLAAEIIERGDADVVAIGREALVDPNWALRARLALAPERGYSEWPVETGWWLDRRQADIGAFK